MLDLELIPDSAFADAIQSAFGGRMLVKRSEGYNFRCPVCGDTSDNPNDRNAWILTGNGNYWYYCFKGRCGTNKSLLSYLKENEFDIYQNLIFHGFVKGKEEKSVVRNRKRQQKKITATGEYLFDKGELLSIYDGHPTCLDALQFVRSRKIPEKFYSKWYVAIKDSKFLVPNGGKGNMYANRIIIPYYNLGGSWKYFQGRAIYKGNALRYLSAPNTVDKEFYRIDWLDVKKPFFLLEGAVDSTFINNAIAFSGTGGLKRLLRERSDIIEYKKNAIFIWDNTSINDSGEATDEAGRKMMEFTSRQGFSYFDWNAVESQDNERIKDINDLVLCGKDVPIDKNGMIKEEYLTSRIKKPKLGIELELEFDKITRTMGIQL